MKRMTEEDIEKAKHLRRSGWAYQKIANELGFAIDTVHCWINDNTRAKRYQKKKEKYCKERDRFLTNQKEKREEKFKTLEGRCKESLRSSGKNKRYKKDCIPCNSPINDLIDSFTGKCHICGIPEIECKRRLSMDYDHITGKFRGWLCKNCNLNILAGANDNPTILRSAASYLENNLELKEL